jgi:hypothetical protein
MAQAFTFRAFGAGTFQPGVLRRAKLFNAFGVSAISADDLVEAQVG